VPGLIVNLYALAGHFISVWKKGRDAAQRRRGLRSD
jgi:hypothetical protein